MSMELSIIYRVVYQPHETFKVFIGRGRIEVFVPILIIAIYNMARTYFSFPSYGTYSSFELFVGLITVFLYSVITMLLFPLIETICFDLGVRS